MKEQKFEKVVEEDKSYLYTIVLILINTIPLWYDIVFKLNTLSDFRLTLYLILLLLNFFVNIPLLSLYFDSRKVYWRKIK